MTQRRRVFELEGLKFEIGKLKVEVTGDDPEKQLKLAITDEVTRALAPVTEVLRPQMEPAPSGQPAVAVVPASVEKRSVRRAVRGHAANSSSGAVALDFKPNLEKYGNPTVEWSTGEKAMWLLYCYSKENGGSAAEPKGLTIPVITATFNKHFPHAKTIRSNKVYRDFNAYAGASQPKVTPDRAVEPPVWYLQAAGIAAVEELIKASSAPLRLNGVA